MAKVIFSVIILTVQLVAVVLSYYHRAPHFGDRLYSHYTNDHGLHYYDYPSYGHPRYYPHYRNYGYPSFPHGRYIREPDYEDDDDSPPRRSAFGRQTKYTVRNPHRRGHLKVTETHVQMNREMHPHEAEHTMKKIMSSMSGNRDHFKAFVKGMGFHL